MAYFTYDTSVLISRRLVTLPVNSTNFLMSAVVLVELSASAKDTSQLKVFERLLRDYRRDNLLIVPTMMTGCSLAKFCIG